MGLRIFSVVGEALNFGGRRMETIARVAWLPLVLSMIVNMAAIFAYLSVITGRIITFSDVPTFFSAQQALGRLAAAGFQQHPTEMWLITAITLVINGIISSSYMAPLIRYSGLGEKPSPGAVKLHFGPDQLRFIFSSLVSTIFVGVLIFGPILSATYYSLKYIADALSKTVVTFPDPNSLHTIEVTTVAKQAAASGTTWIYDLAMPLAAIAPMAALLWLLIFLHVHPRNRPGAFGPANELLRATTTLLLTVTLIAAGYFWFKEMILNRFAGDIQFLLTSADFIEQLKAANASLAFDMTGFKGMIATILQSPASRVLLFGTVSFYLVNYFGLRLFAYPGVAVCRKSFALGNTLKVTRGWDFIRLAVIVFALSVIMFVMYQYVINVFLFRQIFPMVLNYIFELTRIGTRMVNSGVTADWVLPTFTWIWNILKILINLLWTFFAIGVGAGLYGRLYRESERAEA